MGLFGDTSRMRKYYRAFGQEGERAYGAGNALTEEGLGGLRDDLKLFDDRLRNPLGEEGESIFRRASGQISDTAIRRNRASSARLAERARQSGGSLSAAAVAELEQQTQRDVAEEQFKSEFDLASEKASLTLTETNRLFDRRNDIRKTILGVGEAGKDRGLQMWLEALGSRERDVQARRNMLMGLFGGLTGAATSGATGGGGNPGG